MPAVVGVLNCIIYLCESFVDFIYEIYQFHSCTAEHRNAWFYYPWRL